MDEKSLIESKKLPKHPKPAFERHGLRGSPDLRGHNHENQWKKRQKTAHTSHISFQHIQS